MPLVDVATDPASPTHISRHGEPGPPRGPRMLPLPPDLLDWRPYMPLVDVAVDPASPTHISRRGEPGPTRDPGVLPLLGTTILSRWRLSD